MPLSRTNRGNKFQTYSTTTAKTLVSDSFTPAAGALLLCLFQEATTDATPSLTMSSTFTGQGAWTVRYVFDSDGFGSSIVSGLAWSVCGGSPGAGTITATRRAGSFAMGMNCDFVEVNGEAAAPERQFQTASDTASVNLAVNFSSNVLSTSYLFWSSLVDGTTGVVTAPSGASLVSAQFAIGSFCATSAEKLGSGSQNNTIGGSNGGTRQTAVAIEIAELLGQPHIKRLGGIPFAGGTSKGLW